MFRHLTTLALRRRHLQTTTIHYTNYLNQPVVATQLLERQSLIERVERASGIGQAENSGDGSSQWRRTRQPKKAAILFGLMAAHVHRR
jgi:hypothetical protein